MTLNNNDDTKEISKVLEFWFEETKPKQWYQKDDEFDALVKEKFESLYWRVLAGKTKSWRTTAEGRLAEIIVLDQFARNMFRGDKQSFSGDEMALELAREALQAEADKKLPAKQRQFLYMPFMHSESREVHEEALEIFKNRADQEGLEYEIRHKAIIDRFGRYPHRNETLGRTSTPEELKFLEEGGGF